MKTLLEKKEFIKLLIPDLKSIFKRRTFGLIEKEMRSLLLEHALIFCFLRHFTVVKKNSLL